MAFASKLIDKSKKVEDCPPLMEEKYKEKREKLIELLSPPVMEITIGKGEHAKKIGGEEVLFRHELTFFNPCLIAVDVSDDLPRDEIVKRVNKITALSFEKIGKKLKFDAIAVRCKSNDPTTFADAVLGVYENSDLPLILCSLNPEILRVGAEIARDRKPLLYAATVDNYKEVAEIAKQNSLPVVVSNNESIDKLLNLARKVKALGVNEILLDPGTEKLGSKFASSLNKFIILRKLAIEEKVREAGYPLLALPIVAHISRSDDAQAVFEEACIAAMQLIRYADAMIVHTPEIYFAMPLLTLRLNIYTDPRVPVSVEPKLYEINNPNGNSPVFLTTNFALTYFTVANDIESAKIPCYILVADTEGLAVEVSMAGKKLTPSVVKEAIEKAELEKKIKHRKLIIPGVAARLKGELEDAIKWEIIVGPRDSSQIKEFIEKHWKNGNEKGKE